MKIKVNDNVVVKCGKNQGKTGKVMKAFKSKVDGKKEIPAKVVVEGVNVMTKHQKPKGEQKGEIIKQEAAMQASNVMVVCPLCQKPTRVGFEVKDGKKVRKCKKCKKTFK